MSSRLNKKKKEIIKKDTTPIMKNGGKCATATFSDTKALEATLAEFYYNTTKEDDTDVQCDWYSLSSDAVLIKYNNKVSRFEASLTLYHATGCLSVQGNFCQQWIDEHFPKLDKIYQKKKEDGLAPPIPFDASTPCKQLMQGDTVLKTKMAEKIGLNTGIGTDVETDVEADIETDAETDVESETETDLDTDMETDCEGTDEEDEVNIFADNDLDGSNNKPHRLYDSECFSSEEEEETISQSFNQTVIEKTITEASATTVDKPRSPTADQNNIAEDGVTLALQRSPVKDEGILLLPTSHTNQDFQPQVEMEINNQENAGILDGNNQCEDIRVKDKDKNLLVEMKDHVIQVNRKNGKQLEQTDVDNMKKHAKDDIKKSNRKMKEANSKKVADKQQTLLVENRRDAKIENNRISIDHIERELIARVEFFESKYVTLEQQFNNLKEKITKDKMAEKEVEEKHKKACRKYEDEITNMKAVIAIKDEEIKRLDLTIKHGHDIENCRKELSLEIGNLRKEIRSKEDGQEDGRAKTELLSKVADLRNDYQMWKKENNTENLRQELTMKIVSLQSEIHNNEKEKQAKDSDDRQEMWNKLRSIEQDLVKKASWSEVEKLRYTTDRNDEIDNPVMSQSEILGKPNETSRYPQQRSVDRQPPGAERNNSSGKDLFLVKKSNKEECRLEPGNDDKEHHPLPSKQGTHTHNKCWGDEGFREADAESWSGGPDLDDEKPEVISEKIVLLMDSNRTHIHEDRFWPTSTVKKLKVGRASHLKDVVKRYNFINVEHIIIATGTNDTDNTLADDVFSNLAQGARKLKEQYESAHVYISQVPPRKKLMKPAITKLNLLIERGVNQYHKSINIILQKDLDVSDLHDEKHIKISSIGKYVANMKDRMREVLGLPPRSNQPRHPSSVRGGKQLRPNQRVDTKTDDDLQWMQIMQTAMERNNQMMMENMKNIITSHLSNPSG